MSLDGTTLDVGDTMANARGECERRERGRGRSPTADRGVLENGKHAICAAQLGGYRTGEVTLAAAGETRALPALSFEHATSPTQQDRVRRAQLRRACQGTWQRRAERAIDLPQAAVEPHPDGRIHPASNSVQPGGVRGGNRSGDRVQTPTSRSGRGAERHCRHRGGERCHGARSPEV